MRKLVAMLGVAAFLFAQIAGAAHACAALGLIEAPGVAIEMQAASGAVPCNEVNVGQSTLCFHHCQDSRQIFDHHQPPSLGFVATFVCYPEQPFHDGVFSSAVLSYSHVLLARATAPPIAVQNCCIRS